MLKKEEKYTLSLALARKMAEAAEKKSEEVGVPIIFSVVDEGGNLLLLNRMENAILVSIDISINKAYTSVFLKLPTDQIAPLVQPGASLYGLQNTNNNRMVVFGGGYPLKIGNQIVGGIGVSGGSVEEDMLIASEALKVFKEEAGF
ncbi:MAG: heme-binding protein [Thermotaleaceae bacterium]